MAMPRSFFRSSILAGAIGAGLLVLVPAARAEDRVSLRLETLVPARSLAFAGFEDIGSWGRRWNATAIAKLGADPDMAAFLAPVREDLKKLTEGGDGKDESPLPPIAREAFRQVQGLSGQAAVALVDVAGEMPTIVAGLDFGEHLRDFVTFLQRMKESQGDMPLVTEEKDGRPWWAFEASPGKGGFYGTTIGTSVLVSTDRAWLDAVVASKGAAVADAIGSTDGFLRAKKSVGDASLFVYGNLPAIFERVLGDAPPDLTRTMKAMGLDSLRNFAYGFGFQGEVFRDTFAIDLGPGQDGILKLMKGAPITRKGLAMAPSTAFLFNEGSLPFSRLLPALKPMLAEIDRDIPAKIERAMADAKAATGVDIENDLLPLLADDLSYYVALPETGGLYPEIAISFGLKDPARFEEVATKAVDGLLQTIGREERVSGTQRTLEWHGKRLHVVDLSSLRRRDVVPFTPTWAVLGDRWVLTLVPHAMKELILRMEAGGKGLAGQEDVMSILRAAPANATGLGYIDLQAVLSLVYDTGVPLLQTAVKPNMLKEVPVRLDWALLPAARTVRPYFRSIGTHTHVDGDSIVVQIDSPVGYILPFAVVGGAAALFAMRRMSSAMELHEVPAFPGEGGAMLADLQVKSLAETVRSYQRARGSLPASLGQLVQETNTATGRPWLDRVRRDPWGGEYEYVVRNAAAGDFIVRSAGADRIPDTVDDIVHPTASDK